MLAACPGVSAMAPHAGKSLHLHGPSSFNNPRLRLAASSTSDIFPFFFWKQCSTYIAPANFATWGTRNAPASSRFESRRHRPTEFTLPVGLAAMLHPIQLMTGLTPRCQREGARVFRSGPRTRRV